jgi:hypothetical protein
MLSTSATIWPMIAHVALVFFLYIQLGRKRASALAGGYNGEGFRENLSEPKESLLVNNNLKNQFELPMLFHAASLALYATTADNIGTVILGWIFVVTRYAHTYFHLSGTPLRYRRQSFILGLLALLGMWIWLAVWIIFN